MSLSREQAQIKKAVTRLVQKRYFKAARDYLEDNQHRLTESLSALLKTNIEIHEKNPGSARLASGSGSYSGIMELINSWDLQCAITASEQAANLTLAQQEALQRTWQEKMTPAGKRCSGYLGMIDCTREERQDLFYKIYRIDQAGAGLTLENKFSQCPEYSKENLTELIAQLGANLGLFSVVKVLPDYKEVKVFQGQKLDHKEVKNSEDQKNVDVGPSYYRALKRLQDVLESIPCQSSEDTQRKHRLARLIDIFCKNPRAVIAASIALNCRHLPTNNIAFYMLEDALTNHEMYLKHADNVMSLDAVKLETADLRQYDEGRETKAIRRDSFGCR
jgi:hypothetical protein